MSLSQGKNWEGIGGPVHFYTDKNTANNWDPTLESCCQREIEERRNLNALRSTLRKYDVIAERERRRRHSVFLNQSNSSYAFGETSQSDHCCRCSYDPDGDGGEYLALIELRAARATTDTSADNEQGYNHDNEASNEIDSNFRDVNTKDMNDTCTKQDDGDTSDDEYDYLLDDDLPTDTASNLNLYEETRRAELEWEVLQNEIAMQYGYGVHRQIHPSRILLMAGLHDLPNSRNDPPPNVVLHLVDSDSIGSASLDLYLEQLATKYRGTMFIRSSGRTTILLNSTFVKKVLPMFNTTTQVDYDLPALVAIRDGLAVNACLRLQGLLLSSATNDEIEPNAVFDWLDRSGVLSTRPPNIEAMCHIRPEEQALMDSCRQPTLFEEEVRYDCGRDGCNKSFLHRHVGEQNEKQDGLVVSEAEILGEL
jgi:hypothetical protein